MLSITKVQRIKSSSCLLGCVVALLSGGTLCAQGIYAPVESTTWNPERPLVFPSAYVRADLRRTYRRLFGEYEAAVPIEYDAGRNVVCPPAQGVEVVPTPAGDALVPRRTPSDAVPRTTPSFDTPMPTPDNSWIPPVGQTFSAADNSIREADDRLPESLIESTAATDRRSSLESIAERPLQSVRTFDPSRRVGQGTLAELADAERSRRREHGLRAIVVPAVQFDDTSVDAIESDPIVQPVAAPPANVPRQPPFRAGMQRLGELLLRID